MDTLAKKRQVTEIYFANEGVAFARQLQRRAKTGELLRIAAGVYVLNGEPEEIISRVHQNWQVLAGHLVKGAVVSHISAFGKGITSDQIVTLSHPSIFNKRIKLPGLELIVFKGPSHLAQDLALGASGLYWASRPRMLLENIGRIDKKKPTRAGRDAVEERLVSVLLANKEDGLNRLRDDAKQLAPELGAEKAFEIINDIISALLKTHKRGELKTKQGRLVAQGTPIDNTRLYRFELLANTLRTTVLPNIADVAATGVSKIHFAFIESYFSNYVEGTRFSVAEAEGIVLRNELVTSRPKDSHDVLGVYNQIIHNGSRDTVPPPGIPFLAGLQARHLAMLSLRPESNPGQIKTEKNYAGSTTFVEPEYVHGTMQTGSEIALTVPEGLARAIFYAFLVSEIHPFDDGNGRLSRLTMNAELSRLGLCRIIIPTLYHPQYIDCQKALSQKDEVTGFITSLKNAAQWCAQFDYVNLPNLISSLKKCNAFEESPAQFRLLNQNGSHIL